MSDLSSNLPSPHAAVRASPSLLTKLSVHLSGATEKMSRECNLLNGVFIPTEQVLCGATVFLHAGYPHVCLRYFSGQAFKGWLVQLVSDQGTATARAKLPCAELTLPDQVWSSWSVIGDSSFFDQPDIKCKMVLSPPPSEGILISGITAAMRDVSSASLLNGLYIPTPTFHENAVVYQKMGNPRIVISSGFSGWLLGLRSELGQNKGYGELPRDGNPLPHQVPPGAWKIHDGSTFIFRPSVTCTKVLVATCGLEIAGVTSAMTSASTAAKLNGTYTPISEAHGGASVYKKAGTGGDPDMYITYNCSASGPSGWVAQTAANKGTPVGYAHLFCGLELPNKVVGGVWNIVGGEQEGPAAIRGQSGDRLRAAMIVEQQYPGLGDEEFLRRVDEWMSV